MTRDDDFLARWSRRKHASRRGEVEPAPPPPPVVVEAPVVVATPEEKKAQEPLPPVESLTPESDFTPFMRKEVDPALRQQALKTLFRDPRFNVMDGLDVYIDDFSKPDPLPPDWLGKLQQMARLGDYAEVERQERAKAEAERKESEISEPDQQLASASPVEPETPQDAEPPPDSIQK